MRVLPCVLLVAATVPSFAQDSLWTGDGDNDNWSNPENWSFDTLPGTADAVDINPNDGPSTATITLDTNVMIDDLEISDGEGAVLSTRRDLFLTINGQGNRTITVDQLFELRATDALNTGLVSVTLNNITVMTRGFRVSQLLPSPGQHQLVLNGTSFTVFGGSGDLEAENLHLFLGNDSVFRREHGIYTPEAGSTLTFTSGGVLDWDMFYDDADGQAMTFHSGGGHIYGNLTASGDISVLGANTGMTFGNPDSTVAHSAGISGRISGNGGVVVNSDLYQLSLLGSNTFTGGLYLHRGTVSVGSGPNLGGLSNFLQFTGGTLETFDGLTISIDAFIQSGTLDTDGSNVTYTGDWSDISGFAGVSFTKTGEGTLTLNNDGSDYTGSLVIEQGTVVSGAGDTFSNQTAVTVNAGAILRFDQAENFDGLNGAGEVQINGQSVKLGFGNTTGNDFAGQLTGAGTLTLEGPGRQRFSGDNTGFTGMWVHNGGTLAFGSTLSISSDLHLDETDTLAFDPDAAMTYANTLTGSGLVKMEGDGTLALTGDSGAFTGGWEFDAGRVNVEGTIGGGVVLVRTGSTVGGNGLIDAAVAVNSDGIVAPGTSAGILTVGGLFLNSSPRIEIELGGVAAGTEYDRLIINGELSASGTLDVTLIDSYDPTAGTVFDILDWGTLTGTFDEVLLPTLGTGLLWDDAALYTTGELKVLSNGDLNGDGLVGVEDLDIILANWGDAVTHGALALGDADGSGAVGQADLDIVLSHWGNVTPIAGDVPEPGTAFLFGLGVLASARRPRRVA